MVISQYQSHDVYIDSQITWSLYLFILAGYVLKLTVKPQVKS